MVCVHLANHSQWIAQRFSIKCSWLSCCFVNSDETKCPISIFEAVKWEVEVQISSCFSDSTRKDTKNDPSLVGFRPPGLFFYPLVVSLKAFFGKELFDKASIMELETSGCRRPPQCCGQLQHPLLWVCFLWRS